MIIGITGTNAAGKGTAVDFLKQKGFKHYSARDLITQEIQKRNLPVDRQHMQDVANELRTQYGPAYITEQLYQQALTNGGNAAIESFRCPGEIDAMRRLPNFILLAIDANPNLRYQRAAGRRSATDSNLTFEKFLEDEKRENSNNDPFKQNLSKCAEMADIFLLNDGTTNELEEKLSTNITFNSEGFLTRRPTWDEAFMMETYLWASRSTCRRRKVGAVISTPDHAMIAQGYNGSPRGTPNCIDIGFCERQKQNIPSGQMLEKCKAVHAEANAVINAGRQGKSVDGGVLYCTTFPCTICAGIITNSGIKEIIYEADYANPDAKDSFIKAKIKTRRFEGVRHIGFSKLFKQV
jgi:deoxycytidylate deaminase